jgi:hypothetical protein
MEFCPAGAFPMSRFLAAAISATIFFLGIS